MRHDECAIDSYSSCTYIYVQAFPAENLARTILEAFRREQENKTDRQHIDISVGTDRKGAAVILRIAYPKDAQK